MRRSAKRGSLPVLTATLAAALACVVLAAPGGAASRASAPANTSPPTITGSAVEGTTLTASSGSWTGDTPISFAFQWRQCDTNGAACTDITGAAGQTYLVNHGDVGETLRVNVTATNMAGNATALSAPTPLVVAASPPANTAAPAISGTPQQGQTLTTSTGAWTGNPAPTFTYAWERCNSAGGSCTGLSATSSSYLAVAADVGSTLRSIVKASNPAGNASAQSTPTALVTPAGAIPRATSQPNVTGTLKVGQTLTVGTGTWTGTQPFSYSFAWERCNTNGQCASISGATKQTYVATTSDVGSRVRAVVTARNAFGTGSVNSNLSSGTIAAVGSKPAASAAPVLSGSAQQGSKLTTTVGTWSSATSVRFAYSWLRCDTHGNACATIAGATSSSYTLTAADAGHTIRSQITVTNATGSTSVSSNPTAVVSAQPSNLIKLSDGSYSIPAANVSPPQRLIISGVSFAPARLTSRAPFAARFRVTDTQGHAVRDALVYAIALPYGLIRPAAQVRTDTAGYATITLRPTAKLSLRRGSVVMFVRARKQSDNLLAGISTRRLVQVLVGR